jgi:hypothetical protein
LHGFSSSVTVNIGRGWAGRQDEEGTMLVNDARGNPVTASGPLPVMLLDVAVESYLGFRKDTGDRLKAVLTAEPDFVLAHCLRGYFMMLFGQRAMVSRAQRSLEAAQATARTIGVTPREAAHVAALAAWVQGDFAGTTARWEAIADRARRAPLCRSWYDQPARSVPTRSANERDTQQHVSQSRAADRRSRTSACRA